MSGEKSDEIAGWLHGKGECIDMARSSLAVTLRKLRSEVNATAIPKEADSDLAVQEARKRLAHGLDLVKELETLYGIQMDRIKQGRDLEIAINFLNKGVGGEIVTAKSLLLALHQIRMDLMEGGRNLGHLTINATTIDAVAKRYGKEVAGAMSDPAKRDKIIELASFVAV